MSIEKEPLDTHTLYQESDFTPAEKARGNALYLWWRDGRNICKVCGYDGVLVENLTCRYLQKTPRAVLEYRVKGQEPC